MTWWLAVAVLAAPPKPAAPEPEIEVVPHFHQGQVKIVLAGREGDPIYIDDFAFGVLPLTTELTEGPHRFRVDASAKGPKVVVDLEVKITANVVADIDLAAKPATAPPAPAPVPAPK